MNCLQAERAAKGNATARHPHDRVRRFASRSANARVVKQNDLMIRCVAVRDRWISAIHVGIEVLEKEQRNRPCRDETTVGITNALGLDKLCRHRFVCVIARSLSHSFRPRCQRERRSRGGFAVGHGNMPVFDLKSAPQASSCGL